MAIAALHVLALALVALQAPAQDAVVVRVQCGVERRTTETEWIWRRSGDGWTREGAAAIPDVELQRLRQLALATRSEDRAPEAIARRVGFTPEALAAHRAHVLELGFPPQWRNLDPMPAGLAAQQAAVSEYGALIGWVRARLDGSFDGFVDDLSAGIDVSIALPGEPAISLTCSLWTPSRRRLVLPWKVRVGAERWESQDPALPIRLARWIDPQHWLARSFDETGFRDDWSRGLWEDAEFWQTAVGQALDGWFCLELLRRQPGFDALERAYEPVDLYARGAGLEGRFRARAARVLDRLLWHTELGAAYELRTSALDLLRAVERCEPAIARSSWLLDWKRAAPGRALELSHGIYAEPQPETKLARAWSESGLPGAPDLALRLWDGENLRGEAWLSSERPSALVTLLGRAPGPAPKSASPWVEEFAIAFDLTGWYLAIDYSIGDVKHRQLAAK